jgi:hypothetical protein
MTGKNLLSLRGLGYVGVLLGMVSPDRALSLLAMGHLPAVLADGMVALGDLVGGIALLAGHQWGRRVLLAASAIGMAMAVLTFIAPDASVPRYGPPPSVWFLVHGAVGLSAMWAGFSRVEAGSWQSLADVSYAFLGLVSLWVSAVLYLYYRPPSADPSSNAAGLGFFVGVPFGIAAAVAIVVAGGLSLVGWRDLRLVAMLVLAIAFAIYLGRWWNYEWAPWCIYGLVNLTLTIVPGSSGRTSRSPSSSLVE